MALESERNVPPIPYPLHIEHSHHRVSARVSRTAVCLAGEARGIMYPEVRWQLKANLLEPLKGDLVLVMPPKWSNHERDQYMERREPDKSKQFTLTTAALHAIKRELQPLSTVVARDEDMVQLLANHIGLLAGELTSIRSCVHAQPLPRAIATDDRGIGGDGIEWRRTNDQTGACSPQISLAMRFRACLGLIELAERKRAGFQYTWVVRSRPDISVPCALPFAALSLVSARNMILYQDDFIAMMPRAAAEISLRQVPLASRLNASSCFVDIMRALPKEVTRDFDD
jgi:hypothetical protein